MPHFKSVSGYRFPSLAYHASDDEIKRKDNDYLTWLAKREGWTVTEKTCPTCHGSKIDPAYQGRSRNRKVRECGSCYGSGKRSLSFPAPDTERARRYVDAQRAELERVADDAVEGLKTRLFAEGYRPFVFRVALPKTLADYDAKQNERDALKTAMETAFANCTVESERREAEAKAAIEGGEDINDYIQRTAEYAHNLYHEADKLRSQLYTLGDVNNQYWFRPVVTGNPQLIYVGISNPRRGYYYKKPDSSIIITPGRAPSAEELDRLIADVIETESTLLAA